MDELIDLGFNPYFTGSNSGSLAANSYRRIFLSFNPYFTGSNSGRFFFHNINFLIIRFQSLFYWK